MNTAFFWNNIFNSLVTGTNTVQECSAFIFMEGEKYSFPDGVSQKQWSITPSYTVESNYL
jgi:hypothetical protein